MTMAWAHRSATVTGERSFLRTVSWYNALVEHFVNKRGKITHAGNELLLYDGSDLCGHLHCLNGDLSGGGQQKMLKKTLAPQ